MKPCFEWDDKKAHNNLIKHGIGFEVATKTFFDLFAVEFEDTRKDYGEVRTCLIGMVEATLLMVVYVEREEKIRIISARKAVKHERAYYYEQNAR